MNSTLPKYNSLLAVPWADAVLGWAEIDRTN